MLAFVLEQGAVTDADGSITATQGGCWDYIGPIYDRTGGTVEEPVMTAKTDANEVVFIHVNLRTPVELALSEYFALDANGTPTRPNAPRRVFAGD